MNDLEKILQQISVIMCGGEFKLPTNEYNELHELLSSALLSERQRIREILSGVLEARRKEYHRVFEPLKALGGDMNVLGAIDECINNCKEDILKELI